MTSGDALKMVIEWGFVFVIGCVFVGLGVGFVWDCFKSK